MVSHLVPVYWYYYWFRFNLPHFPELLQVKPNPPKQSLWIFFNERLFAGLIKATRVFLQFLTFSDMSKKLKISYMPTIRLWLNFCFFFIKTNKSKFMNALKLSRNALNIHGSHSQNDWSCPPLQLLVCERPTCCRLTLIEWLKLPVAAAPSVWVAYVVLAHTHRMIEAARRCSP